MRTATYGNALAIVLFAVIMMLLQPAQSAEPEFPAELDAFLQGFQKAFSTRDEQLAQTLFYWEGVNTEDKRVIDAMIMQDLGKRLAEMRLFALPADEPNAELGTNLPVVAKLLVRFLDYGGEVHHSVHRIGVHKRKYFIALPRSEEGQLIGI